MINMVLGTLAGAGYLVLYWMLGAALPEKYQTRSIPVMCITGFLLYYALFEVIALPMKVLKTRLSSLSIVWAVLLLVLLLYILLRRRTVLKDSIFKRERCREKWFLLVFLIGMALGIAGMIGYNTNVISNYDAAYYIGLPSASTYSNTLERMDPFTGKMLAEPQKFYLMNTDTLHSAVVYQLTGLHPLIERKWSFTIAMVILFEMVLYQCAKEFFEKEQENFCMRIGVFCLFANLILFFSYGIANVSHYFVYRTYEGKSITSYFYMSVIFCFALELYRKKNAGWPWCGLFLCSLGGPAFCNTALFVVPAMTACSLFPYVLSNGICRKNWKIMVKYVVVLLPGLLWLILYKVL